jgi:hypothetical protein
MEPTTSQMEQAEAAGAEQSNARAVPPHAQLQTPPVTPFIASSSAKPPHITTESSLAPTSEYMRYLLAAWGARYLFRGAFGTLFNETSLAKGKATDAWWYRASHWLAAPGRFLQEKFPHTSLKQKEAMAYSAALGVGFLGLTLTYSGMVYRDIKNLFRETVAEEMGKKPEEVTFRDISRSENKIVKQTINNFWSKLAQRAGLDLMFFPAAVLRDAGPGDFVLGAKAAQMLADTWKRKTTMFEDLVAFVNNKINPRNGLGQPITQGEVFDLYQHYNDKFHPDLMFSNVLEQSTGEGRRWAESQPIFQRLTELMNNTYAYKHNTIIDPTTGHAVQQANFTLPKFIFLLGNDLIDVTQPERTLTMIEVANKHGLPAVKQVKEQLAQGADLKQLQAHYQITLPTFRAQPLPEDEKNTVLHKGSTMQLDNAPVQKIQIATIKDRAPLASLETAQAVTA